MSSDVPAEKSARKRRKARKVEEAEESEALAAMETGGAAAAAVDTMSADEESLHEMMNTSAHKSSSKTKRRGRPPKKQRVSINETSAADGALESRISTRRARSSRDPQPSSTTSSRQKAPPVDNRNATVRMKQNQDQMEFIRQQQEEAQKMAKDYVALTSSPVARSIMHAQALGQPMPEGIALPLIGDNSAAATSDGINPKATTGATTNNNNSTRIGASSIAAPQKVAAMTAMGITKPPPPINNYINAQHSDQGQAKSHGHGKTAITTQRNQHPQQGTVAPHFDGGSATHTMSPRTMDILIKGGTSVAEDGALSNLPLAAGGGVLSGTTITGSSAGGINSQKGATTMGRPPKSHHQQLSFEKPPPPQKFHKSSKKRKGNGNVKRKGGSGNGGGSADPSSTRSNEPEVAVEDEHPDRLVNPLLDLPPPIIPPQNRHRNSIGPGGDPSSSGGNAEAPPKNVMQASELQAWASIVFPRPDTYPIAQYARWLGFNVPPAGEVADSIDKNYVSPGTIDTFERAKDTMVHHIPPEGQFADQVWKAAYRKYYGDKNDDAVLEGCVDPMYQSFLVRSEDWTTTPGKAANSKSPFKSPVYHQVVKFKAITPTPDRIQEILQQSQDYGLFNADNWSVTHVSKSSSTSTAASQSNPNTGLASAIPTPSTAINSQRNGTSVLENLPPASGSTTENPNVSAVSATPKNQGKTTPAAAVTGANSPGPMSDVVKPASSGKESSQMWGFAAWHKGRGKDEPDLSVVLHYQFQWYHLASASSKEQRIAELVMRVPYGPVPTQLGSPNVTSPPAMEQDYFAEEFANNSNALTERHRLIVILYALVLEHARKCDVCYCLLQVPPSMVPLLEKFFRMTAVPLTEKSEDNKSGFMPMLCDLHKCSTNYALLLQKELLNPPPSPPVAAAPEPVTKHRLLVRLPTAVQVNSTLANPQSTQAQLQQNPNAPTHTNSKADRAKRQRKDGDKNGSSKSRAVFRGALGATRQAYIKIQTSTVDETDVSGEKPSPMEVDGMKEDSTTTLQSPKNASDENGNEAAQAEPRTTEMKDIDSRPIPLANGTVTVKSEEKATVESTDTPVADLPVTKSAQEQPGATEESSTKADAIEKCKDEVQGANDVTDTTRNAKATQSAMSTASTNHVGTAAPTSGQSQALVGAGSKAETPSDTTKLMFQLEAKSQEGEVSKADFVEVPKAAVALSWDILKSFPITSKDVQAEVTSVTTPSDATEEPKEKIMPADGTNELVQQLRRLQEELVNHENDCLEPKVRSLLKQVVEERSQFEKSGIGEKKAEQQMVLAKSEKLLARRRELDELWHAQLEQDMDAVCEICNDGEVTPNNQITFCEACNVAVHQGCYGIEQVPEGDYYCLACRHYGRQKVDRDVERRRLYKAAAAAEAAGETDFKAIVQRCPQKKIYTVCCELCPIQSGAFVPCDNPRRRIKLRRKGRTKEDGQPTAKDTSTWVHMVCAKWQGLSFVEEAKPDLLIEDVTELKAQYRALGYKCALCLGERGAFHECRVEGCDVRLHIMCARSSGLCDVNHGEDALETVKSDPWTLLCPAHSNRPFLGPDKLPPNAIPVQKLVLMAKSLPPEPEPDPRLLYATKWPDNPFNKLTGTERREALANPEYEQDLIAELTKKLAGVRCEVCDQWEEDGKSLTRCHCCGVVFCDSCHVEGDGIVVEKRTKYKCAKCSWLAEKKKENKDVAEPYCVVCPQHGGWLRRAVAHPISKKDYWRKTKKREKSLFGDNNWIHTLCAMWCAPRKITIDPENGTADLSELVMSDGRSFVKGRDVCFLCGSNKGLKEPCAVEECHCADSGHNGKRAYFHPTCARQAGLEVKDDSGRDSIFYVKCYKHGGNEFNLRVRIEDLLEIEMKRAGRGYTNQDAPMTFSDAARIFNASILVMRILGWAWRWAEWWVEYGSNWEPLLEPGQVEKNMTDEELKKVHSTQESRRDDARRCRLAAFGAALRNRAYDVDDDGDPDFLGGFDHLSLEQALRAILSTPSLVGPLEGYEIDFLIDSLGRAYRSKSRILGFGDDKVEPGKGENFCFHEKDGSPKFELGAREVPGRQVLRKGQIFENEIDEVDDFDFYIERAAQNEKEHKLKPKEPAVKTVKKSKAVVKKKGGPPPGKKRGPGRPPKVHPPPESSPQEVPVSTGPKKRGRPPGRPPKRPPAVNDAAAEHEVEGSAQDAGSDALRASEEPLRNRIQRKRTKKRPRDYREEGLEAEPDHKSQSEENPNEKVNARVEAKNGQVAIKDEPQAPGEVAVVVKRKPGRPRKSLSPPAAIPAPVPAAIPEAPPPRKRRRVLGGSTESGKARIANSGPSEVTTTSEPSVLYDSVKQRSRRSSRTMSLEETAAAESYDVAEEDNVGVSNGAEPEEPAISSDDDGDVPISAVVARARNKTSEGEGPGLHDTGSSSVAKKPEPATTDALSPKPEPSKVEDPRVKTEDHGDVAQGVENNACKPESERKIDEAEKVGGEAVAQDDQMQPGLGAAAAAGGNSTKSKADERGDIHQKDDATAKLADVALGLTENNLKAAENSNSNTKQAKQGDDLVGDEAERGPGDGDGPGECTEDKLQSLDVFVRDANDSRKRGRLRGKFEVAKHWPDKTH